ncbi:MAG: transporter [Melioribacteraceae bacterium]|nr:transporter [Melioribacteraceae bacterium]
MNRYFTIVLFFCLTTILFSQELVTDRPDFTESALVVPLHMIQVESGVEYSDFQSIEEFSYPNALFRIGVGNNLEVRFGLSGWTNVSVNDNSNNYLNDLLFEAKYQITKDDVLFPTAIMLVSTLPTGDEEVSVESAEIGVKLATGYDINDKLGLGFNLGFISVESGGKREILSLASVAMGIGITDKVSAFIEAYAEVPQNEVWQPVIDGGFTYLVTSKAQIDLYVGKGLNDYTPDLIIGAGFSFQFNY